jgi:hypothetical protein
MAPQLMPFSVPMPDGSVQILYGCPLAMPMPIGPGGYPGYGPGFGGPEVVEEPVEVTDFDFIPEVE